MSVAGMFFWRKLYVVNDSYCILLKNPYIVSAKLFLVLTLKKDLMVSKDLSYTSTYKSDSLRSNSCGSRNVRALAFGLLW